MLLFSAVIAVVLDAVILGERLHWRAGSGCLRGSPSRSLEPEPGSSRIPQGLEGLDDRRTSLI
jgi:hypothetical protein